MDTRSTPHRRYDLRAAREERKAADTAIVRVEQLYPFPAEGLQTLVESYRSIREAVWVQEEAKNMGAWTFVQPRLAEILPRGIPLRYAGRAASASPATGSAAVHKRELAELLGEAFASARPVETPNTLVTPRVGGTQPGRGQDD